MRRASRMRVRTRRVSRMWVSADKGLKDEY